MPDRQVVSVSPDAESVAINPSLMTHSIVILDANKNNLNQDNDSKVVDEIQLTVNPSFWPQVAKLCQEGKVTSRNYLAFSSAALNPEIIGPMLKELNVSDDTSVFLRSPTVSLDYGKTQ